MNEEKKEFNLPSRLETIDEAALAAAEIAARNGIDETVMFGIDLAMREAVANAVKHGNKFDETKNVKITFEASPQNFIITIVDEGRGFEPESVADPTDADNLLKASGRGIFFMRQFMDEVTWENAPSGGTIVRMTKNF